MSILDKVIRVFRNDQKKRRLEPPATTHLSFPVRSVEPTKGRVLSYFDHAEALRKEFRL
jgi:hypothetical protein